jgi:23S rRNA G2069 N7-methylase RlmK/C1962 C5-methylase RlmI
MYRVRILQLDRAVRRDASSALSVGGTVAAAVRSAVALRRSLNLPREDTTIYRVINSEGDNCSGLVVDVYGTHAVAVASAGWVVQHKDSITAALKQEIVGLQEVIWRYDGSMLEMEGSSAPAASETVPGELLEVVEEGVR